MESKGARPASQFDAGFFGSAVAFAVVAAIAARHQILPGGAAASRTRHDVIESEL